MQNESTSHRLLVHLSEHDLQRLIRSEVERAVGARREPAEWLSAADVAAIVGLHPRSVRRLRGLPQHRLGAKLIRYLRSDLDAWLEQRGAR